MKVHNLIALFLAGALAALAYAGAAPAQTAPSAETTARIIIKFKDETTKAAQPDAQRAVRLAADRGIGLRYLRPMAQGAHVVVLDHEVTVDQAEAIAAQLASDPEVDYAEPDRLRKHMLQPNDPLFSSQTYLNAGVASIGAADAWDVTTGSPGTVIASVDTGIRPHAGLAGRILPGYDFISDPAVANDGDGRDTDGSDPGDWITQGDINGAFKGRNCTVEGSSWHGTMTSGVMAANGNDGTSIAGIDWAARILPVRVLGKCGGYDSDIADGMTWAAGLTVPSVPANPTPAHVINLSLGGTGRCGTTYTRAISAILAHGVTRAIVVAAGNDNSDARSDVPASCPGVIAVAATNVTGQKASYSNFGSAVALAAPGGDGSSRSGLIIALSNTGSTDPQADTTKYVAGTSFSAPMVAGVASLVLAVAPQITAAQMRALLVSNAKPFPAGSSCTVALCGAGIVDANATVRAAAGLVAPPLVADAVEFYNAALDHYFVTWVAAEQAKLDAGNTPTKWTRTGYSFRAFTSQQAGTSPVCRYYIPPALGDSHFFGRGTVECNATGQKNPTFVLEDPAFMQTYLPSAGACPGDTTPVYRLFDNRPDANHRYTTDRAVRDQMVARGWLAEGDGPDLVVMCAPH